MVCIRNSEEIDIFETLLIFYFFSGQTTSMTDYIGENQTTVEQMALVTIQFVLARSQNLEPKFSFFASFSVTFSLKIALEKWNKTEAE